MTKKIATGMLILLALGTATPCFARTAQATLGEARNFSDARCFRNHNFGGTVANDCTFPARYHIPLVTDGSGWHTVRVSGKGANASNNVSCQALSSDNGVGSWVSWRVSPEITLSRLDIVNQLALDVFVPGGGALFVDCTLGTGAFISVVDW